MTFRIAGGLAAVLVLSVLPLRAADDSYSLKTMDKSPAPKELQEPIRKLLAERSVQLVNAKGDLLAEIWLRKDVPAKATDAQVKNGLTYREVPETTLFGAIRFPNGITDYRKQKIPAGVYTLRLANQPQDGDHMGTAPYSEFVLLSPAAEDKSADALETKALYELSAKSTGAHPAVWLLFPGAKDVAEPKLTDKGDGHQVLFFKQDVSAGDKKASIGVGLTLVGAAASA